jgi:hypothetical protein
MDGSMDRVQVRTDEQLERMQKLAASRRLPERGEALTHSLEALEQALDLLTRQLDPVLAPQGPQAVEQTPEEPRTELAALLGSATARVRRATQYVHDLMDRVDL